MTTWIPVIAALTSVLITGWIALRTKRWEVRSQRLMELERRAHAQKEKTFEPLIAVIGEIWERSTQEEATPEWFEEEVLPKFKDFMTWVPVYGSDDLVWTMHRYMQGIFHDPPANIAMRLLTELTLSLRRELGNPDTKVNALDITGFRINDIYTDGVGMAWAALPERKAYEAEGWTPPWGARFRFGTPLKP